MGIENLIHGKIKTERKQVSLKLSEDVMEKVKQIAQEQSFAKGRVLEELIDEGLKAYERSQKTRGRRSATEGGTDSPERVGEHDEKNSKGAAWAQVEE